MKIIQVIVVDDHYFFRKGLITFLNSIHNIKVIGEAAEGNELLELVKDKKPDMIFMDIRMPGMDGIEATRKVLEVHPDIKVIALSMMGDEEYFHHMIEAGAHGFLLKSSENRDLEEAIYKVMSGDTYITPELLSKVSEKRDLVFKFQQGKKEEEISLTRREIEVLDYICKGLTNNEIADILNISP
ncbi:MAG: response regulator transcription factor, partial [bacterium]